MEEFIRIENYGTATRIYLCGVDVSSSCSGITYSCQGEKPPITDISLDLNVPRLLECLANAPEQQKTHAMAVLDSYMGRYKKPDIPA